MPTLADAPYVAPDDDLESFRPAWLVRNDLGGLVISRQHVQRLLADRRLRSSIPDFLHFQGVTSGLLHDRLCATLLAIEGDDHFRVRTLVQKEFVPSAAERHRPLMRSLVEGLVAPHLAAGRCELMEDVAEHYPIQVICYVLGVPAEDHDDFRHWLKAIAWSLSLDLPAHLDEAEAGMLALDGYVTDLIADRRAAPCDDLVTRLVQAEEAGDRLSDDELRSLVIGLLFAGYDTTRNQLGAAVLTFAEHPDQWALLAERPELAPRAVEEAMRHRPAVGVAPRFVVDDMEVDGWHLPGGTLLMLATGAANHDPAQPFDITAEGRDPILSFGGGPHYCLGAALARAELQEALVLLSRRMPDLALDGDAPWSESRGAIEGPDRLPIRFRAGAPSA